MNSIDAYELGDAMGTLYQAVLAKNERNITSAMINIYDVLRINHVPVTTDGILAHLQHALDQRNYDIHVKELIFKLDTIFREQIKNEQI